MGKRPASSNTVRIIAGSLGGRKIRFPDARGLRPTADRTRETLFNWLTMDIQGSRCLDLFAGSGALGIEACSRGADQVIMIEAVSKVSRQLKENVQLLGIEDRVQVVHSNALSWMENTDEQPFDLVFIDPPFADDVLQSVIDALISNDLLASPARLYMERDIAQSLPVLPDNCSIIREKKAGQVGFCLIECIP